jgi:hypothetical protein
MQQNLSNKIDRKSNFCACQVVTKMFDKETKSSVESDVERRGWKYSDSYVMRS